MPGKNLKYLVITVVLGALAINFLFNTFSVIRKTKRLDDLQKEVNTLEAKRSELEEEVKFRLSTEFIEQEARNKLGLVKPGEEVYLKPKIIGDLHLGDNAESTAVLGSKSGKGANLGSTEQTRFRPLGFLDKLKDLLVTFTGSQH